MRGLNNHIGGGIAGGELLVVLSPTGGGKSMMLVKFTTEMLKIGKNVVYYTLELQEKVIGNRIDSCLFDIPLKEIPEYANVVLELRKFTGKKAITIQSAIFVPGSSWVL